jgi:hypothetical protein
MCPDYGSLNLACEPFDFGRATETGYRDSGERLRCLDCGATGLVEEADASQMMTGRQLVETPRGVGGNLKWQPPSPQTRQTREAVEFPPNIPVTVALKYSEPRIVAGQYGERGSSAAASPMTGHWTAPRGRSRITRRRGWAGAESPGYHATSAGKLMIKSKDEMRKRRLTSPDDAYALALTFRAARRIFSADGRQRIRRSRTRFNRLALLRPLGG